MDIFTQVESNVRSYCRSFPTTFNRAKGSMLYGENGEAYIDFFAGAGALNYGHNNEYLKKAVTEYIEKDGIIHGLDMFTSAKEHFLETFQERILEPRGLHYKVQFCGPTGTNAVEAALKLARKVKKRTNVIAFMGGFHGMSTGSLAATSGIDCRNGAGFSMANVTFVPYPSQEFEGIDTLHYLKTLLTDDHSGLDKPAAIILETTQAEGGINVAPTEWLVELEKLCKEHDILMICDDIQVGCGRCGSFFSFERAGIHPDLVTLSKSISGYGFPMSLLLMKPELDIWSPGEHNGTFRGNQLAFIAAEAAIELREKQLFDKMVMQKGMLVKEFVEKNILSLDDRLSMRGIGLIWGIDCKDVGGNTFSKKICKMCFDNGLIIERAGREDAVVKIMPALTIEDEDLLEGLMILRDSFVRNLTVKGFIGSLA